MVIGTQYRGRLAQIRRIVGTSPKKFAAIVRLQNLIQFAPATSLTETGYQAGYYDQAHFIRDFKTFTGETPVITAAPQH